MTIDANNSTHNLRFWRLLEALADEKKVRGSKKDESVALVVTEPVTNNAETCEVNENSQKERRQDE